MSSVSYGIWLSLRGFACFQSKWEASSCGLIAIQEKLGTLASIKGWRLEPGCLKTPSQYLRDATHRYMDIFSIGPVMVSQEAVYLTNSFGPGVVTVVLVVCGGL